VGHFKFIACQFPPQSDATSRGIVAVFIVMVLFVLRRVSTPTLKSPTIPDDSHLDVVRG
jgi:hypothetical protein